MRNNPDLFIAGIVLIALLTAGLLGPMFFPTPEKKLFDPHSKIDAAELTSLNLDIHNGPK